MPGTLTAGIVTLASDLVSDAGRLAGLMGQTISLRGAHLQVDSHPAASPPHMPNPASSPHLLLSGDTVNLVDSLVTTNNLQSQVQGNDLRVRANSLTLQNCGLTVVTDAPGRGGDMDVRVGGELRGIWGWEGSWIAAESYDVGGHFLDVIASQAQALQAVGVGLIVVSADAGLATLGRRAADAGHRPGADDQPARAGAR